MTQRNDDICCGICYESLVEPRVLPCWHVACLRCILGMTKIKRSRAVSCHICRTAFLFENLRSLPRPIDCGICGNHVMNPKKFPCCSNLYCSECITNSAADGWTTCVNRCTNVAHDADELSSARLCQTCFILHTEPARPCGHSSCSHCFAMQQGEQRFCNVCEAVASPNPIPVHPRAPLRNVLQEPAPNLQMVDRMEVNPERLAQEVAILVQQNLNNQNELRGIQGAIIQAGMIPAPMFDPPPYDQSVSTRDRIKHFMISFVAWTMYFRYGLCYWTWIVTFTSVLTLRQKLQWCAHALTYVIIVMTLYMLFYYFWQTVLLWVANYIANYSFVSPPHPKFPSIMSSLSGYIFAILYFDRFIEHRCFLVIALEAITLLLESGRDYLL